MDEYIVLVDANDQRIGIGEKIASHRKGLRHRAFSVILVNGSNILLQRRSPNKYHSPGLWANAACGHPRPDEHLPAAAHRRLEEEMGIRCDLSWKAVTHYKAKVGQEMIENEIVHLFFGHYSGPANPDPDEAGDWGWYRLETIREQIQASHRYSYWLKEYFRQRLI
ncbi:MAG: isopentenyl-diphosphate Delta-isomerase [Sedimenticola sp.]|nr:isopentenyl-diphosphate Delta-isomerase [Sedimenticola sp.]